MNRIVVTCIAAVLAFGSLPAAAQDFETSGSSVRSGGGQGWSVLSGKTLGAGADALHVQLGWPGISFEYLHGVAPKFDFGVKFTFNYGWEGMVNQVSPGLKLQPEMRIQLLQKNKVNLGLKAAPGPWVYFENGSNFGLSIPLSLAMGIAAADALMVNVGMDLPMWILFRSGGGLGFPILFGGGIEYFIDRDLLFTFNLRMGPTILTYAGGHAEFTMEALMGVAFKL